MAQMAHFSFPEQFKFPNSEFQILNSEYFALLRISEFLLKGYNILFRVLTFAKPECDNVLQLEPRRLWQTLKHRKRMLYRHCYIPSISQMAHFSFPEQFTFPNSEYFALLRISGFLLTCVLLSLFILWFSYYVSDIFCKF